ncbi:SRPBCC family protein [Chryseobacterium sp.]|uniref:SRPBCC family protein n=1 Tax=Chryseobacterium sp. TaxID=1871047 RepID=UPI0011C90858|nr:SRPBCC domain-containing protein [Chryseobacterium sp.]TXF78894.1 SRPBCC domain-containing protein [Chryseobacterium sp.]
MHENVVIKQKIKAPLEKVWTALTDRDQMKLWYFDIPDFELALHNQFNFYEPGGANKYHHHGEILEVIPQRKFKHTWSYPEFSKEKSIVKWELEPEGTDTLLTLTHKGLENFSHLGKDFQKESFTNGWNAIIGESLKDFIEKSK